MCKEAPPCSPIWRACILSENGNGDINISSRTLDLVSSPLNALGEARRRIHIEHKGKENTIVHACYPIGREINRHLSTLVPEESCGLSS
jgi:hypothetical protein